MTILMKKKRVKKWFHSKTSRLNYYSNKFGIIIRIMNICSNKIKMKNENNNILWRF